MTLVTRTDNSLLVTPPVPGLVHAIGYMHRHFGKENEWKTAGQIAGNRYHTLPGYFSRVTTFLRERHIAFSVEDKRKRKPLQVERISQEEQRTSGVQIINELDPQENGLVTGPCGIGKTHTIKALIEAAPCQKILVTTDDIGGALQLQSDLEKLLPSQAIGIWCSKRKSQPRPITIATVDSLRSLATYGPAQTKQLALGDFEMWIADEVHTLPSPSRLEALTLIRAPIRYGLTATPKRKDGADFLLEGYFGPIQSDVAHEVGAARGEICPVRVCLFPVPRIASVCKLDPSSQDWRITAFGIVHYQPLHYYIERISRLLPHDGGHIIFADWTKYGRLLHKRLPQAKVLHGKLPLGEIQQIKSHLRERRDVCVITTDVIQKAFNAPPVKYVTMAALGSPAEKIQRIGRATRSLEGKSFAQVHDFIHFQHPTLLHASLASVRTYLEQKWKVQFMGTTIELKNMLARHTYLGNDSLKKAQSLLEPLCLS